MAQFLTVITSFYVALYFLSVETQAKCSNFYFSRHLDIKLQCGIFKTLPAVNHMECHKKCVAELGCFSVNFYQYENKTEVCELIKGSKRSFGIPDCVIRKKGSEHNVLESSNFCSGSCKEQQTRKALPGNWYRLGSFAFKLFEEKKNHTEARAVCLDNEGVLATINSQDENSFVSELYLKEQWSKKALFIKDNLKPLKHWKLDGTDKDVTLLGNLAAENDSYIRSAALHFKGTAGSYATTPAWGISTMTFSISIWMKLEAFPGSGSAYHSYSYWSNPYIFILGTLSNGRLVFSTRKKQDSNSDLFGIVAGQVVLNQWTHVVAVWDRATKQATLYQDGSQVSQSTPLTTSELDLPAPIRSVFDLGYKRDDGYVMKGWLRELLIFDRAVKSEEVNNIKDATLLDPRTWIGAPKDYLNMAPVIQTNTNCLSARAWGPYQWEQIPCDRSMTFICKKPV